MSEPFGSKLTLALKVLSMSRGRFASALGVDKSLVGRWSSGASRPSEANLAKVTELIAQHVDGFTTADWDRSFTDLAARLGADPEAAASLVPPAPAVAALPLAIIDQVRAATAMRGAAYEGFFRSTRPYVLSPGRFLHDHGMIRMDPNGLLSLRMGTAGTFVEGWMLPILNQMICIGADVTSGAMVFGIFNGVPHAKAEVIDGLSLGSALDTGRTPTAFAMMFERIGDLSGDREADDRTFMELAARDPLAPQGSIPEAIEKHLLRDIGPAQAAMGGDLLLQMPLMRSLTRGPAYI